MLKLLYLLTGLALKQTIDETKSLTQEYVDYLKKYREAIAEFRPVSALQKGTIEAAHAIAEHRHRVEVAPEVKKLTKKIRFIRVIPLTLYAVITAGLIALIVYLEQVGIE